MRRGFTLVETMTATVIMGFVMLASLNLLTTGLRSFRRTTTDADLNSTNAQALRRICENLRSAVSVSVTNGGREIDYVLPKVAGAKDAATGEYELVVPVQGDGVARSYVVDFTKGTVTDTFDKRVILKRVAKTDPDKSSSQYGQAYTPFLLSVVGSVHAVTVNLVAQDRVGSEGRYTRYKTTVVTHNVP